MVLKGIVRAGLLWRSKSDRSKGGVDHGAADEPVEETTARLQAFLAAAERRDPQVFDDASWARAAAKATEPVRRRRVVAVAPPHPEALSPPRLTQSPATVGFRKECARRGLPVASAEAEERAGLGQRGAVPDVSGRRALLTADSRNPLLVAARRRIERLRRGEKTDTALSGIWRPITGWPHTCWEEWRKIGASERVLSWLKQGVGFDFTDMVPPIGIGGREGGGNHRSCEEHAEWLHSVFAEFICLGMVREVPYRPKCVSPLAVIPKGDYDPVERPHRLRILTDMREVNKYLDPPSFSLESLHGARGLIRDGDAMLTWDYSAFFHHWAMDAAAQEHIGCTLGASGPLGGRYFVWIAATMGVSVSPWVTQVAAWTAAKRWRRAGVRVLCYSDDLCVWVRPENASAVADLMEQDMDRLGLLRNDAKSCRDPQYVAKVLGVGVDTRRMRFFVTEDKKTDLVRRASELVAAYRRGTAVRVRELARVTGKIMALHVAVGDSARRMTRCCYQYIAKLTGVPPDATRRDLRVAWETFDVLTPDVVEELGFWIEALPGHEGIEIHSGSKPASVVFGSDASDTSWLGFMDLGDGMRSIAREALRRGEGALSSTARELLGSLRNLEAFEEVAAAAIGRMAAGLEGAARRLCGRRVIVYSDNQAAVRILQIGSRKPDLQAIARRIFKLAARHSFEIVPRWRRRDCKDLVLCDSGARWTSATSSCALLGSGSWRRSSAAYATRRMRLQRGTMRSCRGSSRCSTAKGRRGSTLWPRTGARRCRTAGGRTCGSIRRVAWSRKRCGGCKFAAVGARSWPRSTAGPSTGR